MVGAATVGQRAEAGGSDGIRCPFAAVSGDSALA